MNFLIMNYLTVGTIWIVLLAYVYTKYKLLSMRSTLSKTKYNYSFTQLMNPKTQWKLKNEFPKDPDYSSLFKRYSILKYLVVIYPIIAILVFIIIASNL